MRSFGRYPKAIIAGLLFFISLSSFSQQILMFVSHEETYYSEYIVMRQALEDHGFTVDVRSATEQNFTIYMDPYDDIVDAADGLSGSNYGEFLAQYQEYFGNQWNSNLNPIPSDASTDGSILDVQDLSAYVGLIVVGGHGALDYRVDGDYSSQGTGEHLISAQVVRQVAEHLNALAISAVEEGKPVMAQCHGASIPAFWRIPETQGEGAEELGFSLIKGGEATGYPEEATGPELVNLDITHMIDDRVTVTNVHESLGAGANGIGRVVTTRDWFPQTVAHAAMTFINMLDTYPDESRRLATVSTLILHGGQIDENDCSAGNRDNDVPCNYGNDEENLPADYRDLVANLSSTEARDDFSFEVTDLHIGSESLPYDPNDQEDIEAYLANFDAVIFYKHWSTHITNPLLNAIGTYADNGGGVVSLHHGLYNDIDGNQNKNALTHDLFGVQSAQDGWGADRTNYDIYSTNYGHFISTYLIDYEQTLTNPEWGDTPIDPSANRSMSTLKSFNVFDEFYTNMEFTGTKDFGRGSNEITPLFSNDSEHDGIQHTTGFTQFVNFGRLSTTVGRLAYFQVGERKENYDVNNPFGQVIRNSVKWVARSKQSQSIDLNVSESVTYGDGSQDVPTISSASLEVAYSSSNLNVALVQDGRLIIVGVGNATITASQAGNETYYSSSSQINFNVYPAALTVTAQDQTRAYGEANPNLTYSYGGFVNGDGPEDITEPTISTDAAIDSNVGEYDITLNGGSADNYHFTLEHATLTIEKASQTITLDPISSKTFGDEPFMAVASATSNLPVGLQSSDETVATVDGLNITVVGAGNVVITASQNGDQNFLAAENVQQEFTVEQASQTITFSELTNRTFGDDPFTVEPTSSSGLAVQLSSSDENVASVDGLEITIHNAGSTTITASQPGNDNYENAEVVERQLVVDQAGQSITFSEIADRTFGDEPFNVSPEASSDLSVALSSSDETVATVDGFEITIVGAGSTSIVANQSGNNNYTSAETVEQQFVVNKANQIITFATIPDKIITDPAFDLDISTNPESTPTLSISGPANLNGFQVVLTGQTGTVEITATLAETANYNQAQITRSFNVSNPDKLSQTITFATITDKVYNETFSLQASSTSELPISYSVVSGPVSLDGNTVTITGVGTATIRASQDGDDTYNAAESVDQTFTIFKADQSITFAEFEAKDYESIPFDAAVSASSNLAVSLSSSDESIATVNGMEITIHGVGTSTITASQGGDNNYNSASPVQRLLTVDKADQTISITPIDDQNVTFNTQVTVIASTNSNLPLTYVVAGPASNTDNEITLSGEMGEVTVTVSQSGNQNYESSENSTTFQVTRVLSTHGRELYTFYPNPVRNILTITGQVDAVSLYSISGNLIKKGQLSSIDMSELSNGLYFLSIRVDGKEFNHKILLDN